MNLKYNEEIGLVYDTIYWHSFTFNRKTYEQLFSEKQSDDENYDEFYSKFDFDYSPDIKLYPFFYCDSGNNSVLAEFFTDNLMLEETLDNLLASLSGEAFEQFTLKKLMRVQDRSITYDEFRNYIYESSFNSDLKFGCLNLILAFDEMLEKLKESLVYVYEHVKLFRQKNESIINKAYKENSSNEVIGQHAKIYCCSVASLKKLQHSISLFNKYLSFIHPKKGCIIWGVNICNHIFARDNNKCVPLTSLKISCQDPAKKALILTAVNHDEFTIKDVPERVSFTEQSMKNKAMELVDAQIFTTYLKDKKRYFSLNRDSFNPGKQFEQFLDVLSTPAKQDIFMKAALKKEFTVTDISNDSDYSLTYVSKIVWELFSGGLLIIKRQEHKKRYYSINKIRIEAVKKSSESFFDALMDPNKRNNNVKLKNLLNDPNFDTNIV